MPIRRASIADPDERMARWRPEDFSARVSGRRQRYAAGSPSGAEIEAYRDEMRASLDSSGVARALVLGMTPELRQLAVDSGSALTSVDHCEAAIEAYGDWISPEATEKILRREWTEMDASTLGHFGVVFGDGVFPNLLSLAQQQRVLRLLGDVLADGARGIFRQPLLPESEVIRSLSFDRILDAYRRGAMSVPAFALTARLWGFASTPGVLERGVLDNARVFELIDARLAAGDITPAEHESLQIFSYSGKNLFLTSSEWESAVHSEGLSCRRIELTGEPWYAYYPLYVLERGDAG